MKIKLGLGLWLTLGAALLWFSTAQAKAAVVVRISGPGLEGEIEVRDEKEIAFFNHFQYTVELSKAPENVSESYFEIRVGVGEDVNHIRAIIVYHYYPGQDGESGVLYYADAVNGSSSAEGNWFVLTEASDANYRDFLTKLGADLGESLFSKLWAGFGLPSGALLLVALLMWGLQRSHSKSASN